MIKNIKILEDFKNREIKKSKFSYNEALKIYEGLWNEAIALGILPDKDPLEGIEIDIKIAKILNSCLKNF